MAPPTIQLFVRPDPDRRLRRRVDRLCRVLAESGAEVILTEGGVDPPTLDTRAEHACAVGGDGTLRHVIAAVRKAGRPVGISVYPAGTVNLTAMELAYPREPHAFVRHVLTESLATPRHFACVGEVPLVACASVGPDSRAVALLSPRLKVWFGRSAYLVAFLRVLAGWRRERMVLHHDGRHTVCEAAYIAKGPYFAGRWSVAPHARGTEPLLHVVAMRRATRLRFLRFAWAIFRHRVQDAPGLSRFTCTELTIESKGEGGMPLQVDGDVVTHLPAMIRLATEPVRFV